MVSEKVFETYKGNQKIKGKIFWDNSLLMTDVKLPVMITSHGFGCDCTEMERYCKYFSERGYLCLAYNFCGGGGRGELQSDGESTEMNVFTEIEDLLAVIEYVKGLECADTDNITLLGFSQGGFVSGLTASRLDGKIANLVMICPAICIPDHARLGMLGGAKYDLDNIPESWTCPNGMVIGRQFHEAVKDMDPYLELAKYKGKVLLIAGEKDPVVNYSYQVKAYQCYEEGQCEFLMIRDGGHGFGEDVMPNILVDIESFLQGKKNIMSVNVFCTKVEEFDKTDDMHRIGVFFTGYSDGDDFRGIILPGACDTQTKIGDGDYKLCADYTLSGVDKEKQECIIHVINKQAEDGYFRPTIDSDSKYIRNLINGKDIVAALEFFDGGLTVRLWG